MKVNADKGIKEGTIALATREGDKLWIDGVQKRSPDPQIMDLLPESGKAWIEYKGGKWQALDAERQSDNGRLVKIAREGGALWIDGSPQADPDPELMKLMGPSEEGMFEFKDARWQRVATLTPTGYGYLDSAALVEKTNESK